MATIRERQRKDGTKTYHVQVRIAGYPARTETFSTRPKAERWAKTVEAEMIDGRHFRNVEARRRTVGEAIDRYIEAELPKKRDSSPTWLNWWKAEVGRVTLANLTPALIVEKRDLLARGTYTRSKAKDARRYKRSPKTVNKYLRRLSHVLTVARKEWHWMSHNPMHGVSMLPEDKGRVRYLSDDERKALLAETGKDPVLHLFVLLALTTACRAGELLNLTWADVDLKEGRLLFRQTKNAEPRTAWAQGTALELLKAHAKVRKIAGGPVFENASGRGRYQYAKRFKVAVEAAEIENFRFHDLRHSAATYLAQQGATEQQLRAIGGWKSGVVSRYVHLAAEDSRDAVARLAAKIEGKKS